MGDFREEYNKLYDYRDKLLRSNPGSTCVVLVDIKDFPKRHLFRGFYVCFKVMKDGFKHDCRRWMGMDGCFLKGLCKGKSLFDVCKDENNQMYPLAWAVIEGSETKDIWEWFMKFFEMTSNWMMEVDTY
ncbi:hypothetical protein M5689_000892 [Euphorbia peplus]|nr:hypothetical protein M5689_000892 [Euphorbia peplus]